MIQDEWQNRALDELTRIRKLLEILVFDEPECEHRNILDLSVMGQAPRTHFFCKDCKREIHQDSVPKI